MNTLCHSVHKMILSLINAALVYIELSKPRIVVMVLVTSVIGYVLAGGSLHNFHLLLVLIIGTALSCAGASALNMYLERDVDRLMKRTKKRALVRGAASSNEVLLFGVIAVLSGVTLLVLQVNLLTGFLSLLTAFLYVLVYTPLKRITWLNTLVGSIPGALPPMGGWAAATDSLGAGAWVLFAILFIWQQPHFYAIAWMYREDYARAGLKMLPVVEPDGDSTFSQILIFSYLLIPVALLPTVVGVAGATYFYGAFILSLAMLSAALCVVSSRSVKDARRLLHATIIYLPLLLVFIIADAKVTLW